MKIVHTYKELRDIAGEWETAHIKNDYVKGANHFKISYNGETVLYQNDDITNVASCASQYNGLSWWDVMRFNPANYKDNK